MLLLHKGMDVFCDGPGLLCMCIRLCVYKCVCALESSV